MQWKNDDSRYGCVAQALHWAIVALVVTKFVLASVADDLALGPAKIATLARHKSIGITLLGLVLLRLLWRWLNPAPAVPAGMQRWKYLAARATHLLLYALLLAIPVLGWLMSSARNFPVSWFGVFTLPDLVDPDRRAYELFHAAHEVAAKALFVAALVHVAAALKHHFVDRDNVLRRMLPVQLR
jgi:cytochrome b561